MKEPCTTPPMEITPTIAAKCDGPDQFEKFDRLVRGVLAASIRAPEPSQTGHPKKRPAKKRA